MARITEAFGFKLGDVVEFNKKRHVVIGFELYGKLECQYATKKGKADKRTYPHILTAADCKKVGEDGILQEQSKSLLVASDEANHLKHMIESMETYTKHSIECGMCTKRESVRDVAEARFARRLYKGGWRYLGSEKYAVICAMCPECAKDPEKDQ